jgi:hypothetical protein
MGPERDGPVGRIADGSTPTTELPDSNEELKRLCDYFALENLRQPHPGDKKLPRPDRPLQQVSGSRAARIDDPLHLLHRLQIPVRQINSAAAANALQPCLELFVVQRFCGREVERQGEG